MRYFRFAVDAFRRDFKSPLQNQRDWETENQYQNHQAHGPVRDFKKRKDLRRDLN